MNSQVTLPTSMTELAISALGLAVAALRKHPRTRRAITVLAARNDVVLREGAAERRRVGAGVGFWRPFAFGAPNGVQTPFHVFRWSFAGEVGERPPTTLCQTSGLDGWFDFEFCPYMGAIAFRAAGLDLKFEGSTKGTDRTITVSGDIEALWNARGWRRT
jgi:hypothetical protein